MRCHYEVFELPRTATIDEIKKQYKRLALKYHPDKNVGNEEAATENFKAVTAAYSCLSDPQERKWYDDHRESILRGGDGVSDDSSLDSPLVNLWKYFNASCFNGFHEGEGGFYKVYGDIFTELHNIDFRDNPRDAPDNIALGNAASSDRDISHFYGHWTNFVTVLSFSWEDKYNVLDAPNRYVKRAMEKENKKLRDSARKKYIETVRALAEYVRKRDTRVMRMEADRKKKAILESEQREEKKRAEKEKRREEREKWKQMQENDEEEAERRANERQRAFLLAEEYPSRKHKTVNQHVDMDDDEEEDGDAEGYEVVIGEAEDVGDLEGEDFGSEEEEEEEERLFCDVCRKDFKTIPQLDQHLASKAHRKKAQDAAKKAKKAAPTAKGKRSLKAQQTAQTAGDQDTPNIAAGDDGEEEISDVKQVAQKSGEREAPNSSKSAPSKAKVAKKAAAPVVVESDNSSDSDSDAESEDSDSVDITLLSSSFAKAATAVVQDSSTSEDSDADKIEDDEVEKEEEEGENDGKDTAPNEKNPDPEDHSGVTHTPTPVASAAESVFRCEIITPSGGDIGNSSDAESASADDLRCKICGFEANSRNKLFQHVKATGHAALKYTDGSDQLDTTARKEGKKKKNKGGATLNQKKKGNRKGC